MNIRNLLLSCATLMLLAGVPALAKADPNGDLVKAIGASDLEATKAAVAAGGDPNFVAPQMNVPIFAYALVKPNVEVVQYLLEHGANPNFKIVRDDAFLTPLHLVIKRDDLAMVRLLVAHKADLRFADSFGSTPFHYAAHDGHAEITSYLLSLGEDVNQRDSKGRTALHWAGRFGLDAIAPILLEHGADISLKTPEGYTALELAKKYDHAKVAALIEEKRTR